MAYVTGSKPLQPVLSEHLLILWRGSRQTKGYISSLPTGHRPDACAVLQPAPKGWAKRLLLFLSPGETRCARWLLGVLCCLGRLIDSTCFATCHVWFPKETGKCVIESYFTTITNHSMWRDGGAILHNKYALSYNCKFTLTARSKFVLAEKVRSFLQSVNQ